MCVHFDSNLLSRAKQKYAENTMSTHGAVIRIRGKAIETKRGARSAAEKYRMRDAKEMFFRAAKKQRKKTKKKAQRKKPRAWTNKERAEFARKHYEQHHGKIEWAEQEIMGYFENFDEV